jgi:hypothetical protein
MHIPANARPPRRLPVFWPINPTTAVPANPPRFPVALINAMPLAAENPVKNSLGNAQKGLRELQNPIARHDNSITVTAGEYIPVKARNANPPNSKENAA